MAEVTIGINAVDNASGPLGEVARKINALGTAGDTNSSKIDAIGKGLVTFGVGVGQVTAGFATLDTGLSGFIAGLTTIHTGLGNIQTGLSSVGTGISIFALAAAAVSTVGGGLFSLVNKVAEFGEKLVVASGKTGLSVEDLGELKFAAEQSNTPWETLNTALYMFSVRIGKAAIDAEGALKPFDDLGIKIRDQQGNIRPTKDLLLDVAEALRNTKSDTERARLATELMGRGARDMVPFLREGRLGIEALSARAVELGIVMSMESAVASDEFRDSVTELKDAIFGLLIQSTQSFIPMLTTVAGWFTTLVVEAGKTKDAIATVFGLGDTIKSDADKLKTVTDEQAKAFQDATIEGGLFGTTLVAVKDTMLHTQTRTVALKDAAVTLRTTTSAVADASLGLRDNLILLRPKMEVTKEKTDDLTTANNAVQTSISNINLTPLLLDTGTLTGHIGDLNTEWGLLDDTIKETDWSAAFVDLKPPPPETFSDFVRGLGGAFTEPAGKEVIQTALVNAFTNISQGGSFKDSIAAVGVAIGAQVGGPVGAAIASFVTRGLFASSTYATKKYEGIAGEAIAAMEQGGVGMMDSSDLREQQQRYELATRRGETGGLASAQESLAGHLRREITSLTGAESLNIATMMLEGRIYGADGQLINSIIRAALVREAILSGRAAEFRAGISAQAVDILSGTTDEESVAASMSPIGVIPNLPEATDRPPAMSLSRAELTDAYEGGALTPLLESKGMNVGSGLFSNAFAWGQTGNADAAEYLRSQGWVLQAKAGLFRVPGSPSTSFPAILHGQEMVLPAREAEMVRSGIGDRATGGATINFYLQSASDREMVQMIRSQLPMIEEAVSAGMRKGARFGAREFDQRMIRSALQS